MNTIIFSFLSISLAWTEPRCTNESKDKWQDQGVFKKNLIKQGYKIKKFKVTKGNCYEIYGWNKKKNKVEIYFNPITAEVVKKKNW